MRSILSIFAAFLALIAAPLAAQDFPELTGRVVDQAEIIPADVELQLNQQLEALEVQSQRQLVVVTLASLQGYPIGDFGYQLGRHWGIGDTERNDGIMLIVAPNERETRIEVGYGLLRAPMRWSANCNCPKRKRAPSLRRPMNSEAPMADFRLAA